MKLEDRNTLKSKLLNLIKKTELEIKDLEDTVKPIGPENAIGRISRMDAINNQAVLEAAIRSKKKKLTKMKIAIAKIDEEKFGVCELCKNPIPIARLAYMPESNRCVSCADR